MNRWENLSGRRFGRWKAKRFAYSKNNRAYWHCVCACGAKGVVRAEQLKSKHSSSCGCYHVDVVSTHGGATKHPLYRIWWGIVRRCTKEGSEHWNDYGGRGIALYKPWVAFNKFCRDIVKTIGPRPSLRYSLGRLNNDGNYQPGNLDWQTASEQRKNQRKKRAIQNFSNLELVRELKRRGLHVK